MKKSFLIITIVAFALITNVNLKAQFADSDGDGWWDIDTYNDLVLLSQLPAYWGSQFELTNHITVPSGQNFRPIGTIGTPFTGKFKGRHSQLSVKYIIYHLVANWPYESFVGLFGVNSGELSDLVLASCTIVGNNSVGGFCGLNEGSITKCEFYFDAEYNPTTISGDTCVGGYIGWNQGGSVTNCKPLYQRLPNNVYVEVTGDCQVGGGIGSNTNTENGQVTTCEVYNTELYNYNSAIDFGGFVGFNSGNLSYNYVRGYTLIQDASNSEKLGGFVGNSYAGLISNCQVGDSTIVGTNNGYASSIGGFAGKNTTEIELSSSGAFVYGNSSVGGFIGLDSGEVNNCKSYGDLQAFGDYVGGFVGLSLGYIVNCLSNNKLISAVPSNYTGGFSGKNYGNIEYSGSKDSILYSFGNSQGGFVGGNYGNIHDSYSRTRISTTNYGDSIGGFVGVNGQNAYVVRCFSTGRLDKPSAGGFTQYNDYGICSQCFWDVETSLKYWSYSGTGCITAAMKNILLYLNWDFTYIWQFGSDNDGYPSFINIPNYKINFARNQNKIEVYPNPVSDEATIDISGQAPGFTTISVYNINGDRVETLYSGNILSVEQTISFNSNNYTTGMYYLVLESNNTRKMEPIVVKH